MTGVRGRPVRREEPAERLREEWRARSLRAGWSLPCDWWAPAVEAVADAVCAGNGLATACVRLGRARGRAGVGIGETLEDLGALFDVLRWPDPPLGLVRCAAEGWVDAGLMDLAGGSCEDPLTGLATVSYLRSRLAELYRAGEAAGSPPSGTHRLLMVGFPVDGAEPWRRLARAIVVAHDLREFFKGGETLALLGRGRMAALVPYSPEPDLRMRALRRMVNHAQGDDVLVWGERLPASIGDALNLIDALLTCSGRPPRSA
jgi:hypothetical protein